jgi:two-component system, OmpR family, alkaline phosphatase synthesis response regulator PhoP
VFERPKILVLDDEPDVRNLLSRILKEENYQVSEADTAESALSCIEESLPDLVIADINLPGMSGLDFFKLVKETQPQLPFIFLSGLTDEFDKVLGLELGAEDYITKPFGVRELKARVKVVLRRIKNKTAEVPTEVDPDAHVDLSIDIPKRQVFVQEEEVNLTKKEFDILVLLSSRPGQVFTRDHILEVIWNNDTGVSDRTVDVHIGRLREKINIHPDHPPYIETVRGVGYRCNTSIAIRVIQ